MPLETATSHVPEKFLVPPPSDRCRPSKVGALLMYKKSKPSGRPDVLDKTLVASSTSIK